MRRPESSTANTKASTASRRPKLVPRVDIPVLYEDNKSPEKSSHSLASARNLPVVRVITMLCHDFDCIVNVLLAAVIAYLLFIILLLWFSVNKPLPYEWP